MPRWVPKIVYANFLVNNLGSFTYRRIVNRSKSKTFTCKLCSWPILYVRGVIVCIFVALYLRMFVARANTVEGTMSWCLGTNEILASIKHGIDKGRTRALWDRHLDSAQFFRLLLLLQVFRRITLNIFMIQTLCTVMQLFKGSYFSVDAASRHSWPNSAIANCTSHVFMSSVSPASR